eukprot:SAG31_NODE_5491_length_2504_cov_1.442412_5_plen_62_part_00
MPEEAVAAVALAAPDGAPVAEPIACLLGTWHACVKSRSRRASTRSLAILNLRCARVCSMAQ